MKPGRLYGSGLCEDHISWRRRDLLSWGLGSPSVSSGSITSQSSSVTSSLAISSPYSPPGFVRRTKSEQARGEERLSSWMLFSLDDWGARAKSRAVKYVGDHHTAEECSHAPFLSP